jgi:hypothetical protein
VKKHVLFSVIGLLICACACEGRENDGPFLVQHSSGVEDVNLEQRAIGIAWRAAKARHPDMGRSDDWRTTTVRSAGRWTITFIRIGAPEPIPTIIVVIEDDRVTHVIKTDTTIE